MTKPAQPTIATATKEEEAEARARIAAAGQESGLPAISCQQCGKRFQPKTGWQQFCCPAHRSLWHNEAKDREIKALKAQIAELQNEKGIS